MFKYKWIIIPAMIILFGIACAPQPTKEVPDEFKQGQKVFHRVCSNCHGSDAMGGQTKAPRLIDTDYVQKAFSDEELRETVTEGTNKMPSQKNNVTPEEITEVIKYLRYSQKTANLVQDEEVTEEDVEEDEPEEDKGA